MLQPLKMKIPHLQVNDLEIEPTKLFDFASKAIHTLSADQFDLEWVYTMPT